MDNNISNVGANHEVRITDRKTIYLSGVIKIASFDEEEFLLETNMGHLIIKGEGLEVLKLDTHDGIVSIKGIINSFGYADGIKKQKISLFDKMFK